MGLIFLILIIFSAIWVLVWFWFFKSGSPAGSLSRNLKKAIKKDLEKGNYKNAKKLLLKAPDLETNPDNQYKLGIINLKLNEYEEANICFEQVLKKNPKNFDALINLALSLQLQEKYDEAMEKYEQAAKENVKDVNCPLNMGEILYKQGNYERALEILEKAKELTPENVKIAVSILKCKSELCNVDNDDECQLIISEFKKLETEEDLPDDFNISLAKIYARTGNIEDAFEYCKSAVESNEENIEAYKLLGLIQLLKKDFAEAKNSLSVALNFQSNNDEIHRLFSYLLCSHEDGCAMQRCRQKYYDLIRKQQLRQQVNK